MPVDILFILGLHTNKVFMHTNKIFLQFNLVYIKLSKIYAQQNDNFEIKPRIKIRKQYYCDVERKFQTL